MGIFSRSPGEYIQSERLDYEVEKAKNAQNDAKEAEVRTGRMLAYLLGDLRNSLRSRREQRVLDREESKLRVRKKWRRIALHDYSWWTH